MKTFFTRNRYSIYFYFALASLAFFSSNRLIGQSATKFNSAKNTENRLSNKLNGSRTIGSNAGARGSSCLAGGIDLGKLSGYHMVFTNGSVDANWQGASKGFIGNVAIDGIQASERTSGTFAYAGTISTNNATLDAWEDIVTNNLAQASSLPDQTPLITELETDLNNVFTQINALTVSSGYNGIAPTALNGLNTQNSLAETFVININSNLSVSTQISITGDDDDFYILRWDTDMDFSNGYQGQVKFQSGGAIVPLGALKASNFLHVAGDIASSGGGSNPPSPYPQGPRTDNGTGILITGGADFNGGGFFTGYWYTTGDPSNGETSSLSNAIFVGGWYSSTTKFSMTSGTSGVYVDPVCNINIPLPVNFISFNASNINNQIVLNWKTSVDRNFSHFEVQKSQNLTEFNTIGVVNSNLRGFYDLIDKNPNIGNNFYRLKMVDNDGSFELSKIISVQFNLNESYLTVENPAANDRLMIATNLLVSNIRLFNSLGMIMPIKVSEIGPNKYLVQMQNAVSGVYYLNIIDKGRAITKKIVFH